MSKTPKKRPVYYISIDQKPIEVSEAVYRVYYQYNRKERYMWEKDRANGVTFFSQIAGTMPIDCADYMASPSPAVDDIVSSNTLFAALKDHFSSKEFEIIQFIFVDGIGVNKDCDHCRDAYTAVLTTAGFKKYPFDGDDYVLLSDYGTDAELDSTTTRAG